MSLLSSRLVAAAVVTLLDGDTNLTAYLSQGPTPPVGRSVVVHPLAGEPDGVLGDPGKDLLLRFQTTAIGATAEQALWTHDAVAARLWRATVTGTGWTTLPIRDIPGSQQPVWRDDTLATPLFTVTCTWLAAAQPT